MLRGFLASDMLAQNGTKHETHANRWGKSGEFDHRSFRPKSALMGRTIVGGPTDDHLCFPSDGKPPLTMRAQTGDILSARPSKSKSSRRAFLALSVMRAFLRFLCLRV